MCRDRLRIGMVSYYYRPAREGGAERQCRLMAEELVRQGNACAVYTTRPGPAAPYRENQNGVEIYRLRSSWRKPAASCVADSVSPEGMSQTRESFSPASVVSFVESLLAASGTTLFLVGLTMRLRSRSVDVLHVHSSTCIAGYCSWLGKRLGIPVIIKETSFPAFRVLEPLVPFRGVWDKWRRRAYCVAQQEATAESLIEQGVSSERIRVIPNGVQVPSLSGRNEDDGMVLYVGNISQGIQDKGLDVLVEAWARVCPMRPDLRLYIAGSGDPSALRKMASAYGCEDSIAFLGHVADVTAYYRKAALLVLPSRREGMSNVLLEAMSWGIPVIVSDIPGNRAVVQHEETGLITPVGDPDAMAKAIRWLVVDKDMRIRLGKQAHVHILAKYEISVVASELKSFYDYAISKNRVFAAKGGGS